MVKVAFIGCGNMGSALAQGLAGSASLVLFDRNPEKSLELSRTLGAASVTNLSDAVVDVDFVILAVKPKDLADISAQLAPKLDKQPKTTIISLLSGVSYAQLKEKFPRNPLLRAMPNLAVSCKKGIIGFVEDASISQAARKQVEAIFNQTGILLWVPENKIDALMSLTACAPAFAALLIEAFTEGGIHMGFSPVQALPLVMKMFEGTIEMMREQNLHPAALRWKVAAPGGTTIEGLKVLEKHGVHYAIMDALDASMRKASP